MLFVSTFSPRNDKNSRGEYKREAQIEIASLVASLKVKFGLNYILDPFSGGLIWNAETDKFRSTIGAYLGAVYFVDCTNKYLEEAALSTTFDEMFQ